MKAVRMASYADADRTVFGSAGQGTRNFRPGRRIQSRTMPASNIGIYLHRPPDRLGPILRNAGKILLPPGTPSARQVWHPSIPGIFPEAPACVRRLSLFSTERNRGEFLHPLHFFRLVPGPCFQRLIFFRLDFIPARNRINGKLRHPVFHGLGKRPSGSGSSSTGISSSCLRASSSRSRRSSSSLLLFSRSSRSACS